MEYVPGSSSAYFTGGSSAADPTTPSASAAVWDFGGGAQIAPGATLTLTYRMRVKSGVSYGSYVDTATVGARDSAGYPVIADCSTWNRRTRPDDADTASVWVTVPQLTVTKVRSSADATIQAGETAQFSIVVRNTGDSRIDSIPLTDVYDDSALGYFTAVPPANIAADGTATWFSIGSLDPGQQTTVTVTMSAKSVPPGNSSTDTATAGPCTDVQGLRFLAPLAAPALR